MTKNEIIKTLCQMIEECVDDNGEMSVKQEQGTYQDGLIDALKIINK